MNDKISLTGISGFGYHGVLESERKSGQEFLVDVVLYCDLSEAGKSDDLSKTINYADVAALIHKRIIGESVNLLERLAQLIAEDIINNFDVNGIQKIKEDFGVQKFDLAVIDGSEFLGDEEFNELPNCDAAVSSPVA
ncbi:MAG: dihydroneopterin aldolase [Actinobacteria bacterium]|nr:dihydroneopterin aldolase [Actinomycetota bacterium]